MSERTVRRRLNRLGLSMHKDRARTGNVDHRGGYMVVDNGWVVAGEKYDLSLGDVVAILYHREGR